MDGEEKESVTFNGFAPEEILDPEAKKGGKYLLKNEQRKFIREFAVWIYRAIDLYWRGICRDTSEDGRRKRKGIHRKLMPVMGRGSLRKSHTLLDVILALREFRKENENFFLSVLRLRQNGANKIDWRRTVSRTTMLMAESGPLYATPCNRNREINFDEELFVIFYSILCENPLSDLGVKPEDVVAAQPRNASIVMPSYNFARAARELSNGAYSFHYAAAAIAAFRSANAFMIAADTGVKKPEDLHTVFLFEPGANNVLKAVLQVLYSGKVPSKTDVATYANDGIDGKKLVSVKTGGTAEHWLWQVLKWVDV